MLKFYLVLFCTFTIFQVQAEIKDPNALIGNEISKLDTLIQATELSLEAQKKLRIQILEYQKLQDQYLKNEHDNELLLKLVKSAYRALQTIKTNHLEQNFDNDFIEELTIIAQPANKKGITRP